MGDVEELAQTVAENEKRTEDAFKAKELQLTALQDAAGLGVSLKAATSKTNQSIAKFAAALSSSYLYLTVLLVLFIIHQIFIWFDEDPEAAFERAGLLFEVAEVTWDFTGVLWNSGVDVFNAGIIPLWNSASYYLVEPAVVLLLEVFSLIFSQKHWEGLFSEGDFPYNGLDCMATQESAAWCGRASFYKSALESAKYAESYVNDSGTYHARHLAQRNFTFGLATARHLQELSGGGFSAPVFDSESLLVALDAVSTFWVAISPSLLDVVFGVFAEVILPSFSVIMDGFFGTLKKVMYVLKMVVKSGIFTTLVSLGVDFAIIMLTEIALPLLMLAIDLLFCLIDYFKPSGWSEQLRCVEQTCFKGPDASADLYTFLSMNIIIHRFVSIMDATLNARTGRRFFETGKELSSEGRTRNPETGEVIDNKETESAGMKNPIYEFDFAGEWEDYVNTAASDECSKCFACKARLEYLQYSQSQ